MVRLTKKILYILALTVCPFIAAAMIISSLVDVYTQPPPITIQCFMVHYNEYLYPYSVYTADCEDIVLTLSILGNKSDLAGEYMNITTCTQNIRNERNIVAVTYDTICINNYGAFYVLVVGIVLAIFIILVGISYAISIRKLNSTQNIQAYKFIR